MTKFLILALALMACASAPPPTKPHYVPMQVASQSERAPYSCQLLYDKRRKCAFGVSSLPMEIDHASTK
jgi:hypothetical protein